MEKDFQIQRIERTAVQRRAPSAPAPVPTIEMEAAPDLLAYWSVLRKRRWMVLTVFVIFVGIVLLGTLKQKPVFRSRGLIEIQKENPEILTVKEMFELENVSDSYLESQYKILESDTLARRVIAQLGLEQREEFNPPPGWLGRLLGSKEILSAAERETETRETTLKRFRERLTIEPVKRSRLVLVSFESQSAALAARVVNTLASNYIDQNLEVRWEATQKASEWLSQQLVNMKSKLEKSEMEMQQYVRENGLLFLQSEQGAPENIVNERLRQLQEERTRAQAARYEKEALYRLVQAGDFGSLPGVFDSKLMQDLTVRLAEVRQQHAQLAATFQADYPRVKQLQSQIDEMETVLAGERERAAHRITNEYQAALRREKLIEQAFVEQQRQAETIAERSVQYNILKREVDTNKQLYDGLLQRLKEAGVSAGLKASNIRVVDAAEPPKRPARPNLLLNAAWAILLGAMLGVGAAFLQEYLDNTLKTSEDVERFLRLPSLAVIPAAQTLNGRHGAYGYGAYGRAERHAALTAGGERDDGAPIMRAGWYRIDTGSHHAALSEAFRGLRTSVLLSSAERPPRSLLITSSRPNEGKTTVAINLAISLAQLGQRVLLIDGDLRRPSVHKAFGMQEEDGLVRYLTGGADWRACVRATSQPGLDVLVCGPLPPNPAELLSSERMRALLAQASAEYGMVVSDSPPLLNVADSRILATMVEGMVLVVEGGGTPREMARRSQAAAQHVGANLIGVVLNKLDARHDGYGYYYYRYDRETPSEEEKEEVASG
ncbi:MAG TPA: polysaccharide biosynthesis tyrosine autokinase [Candidatus Acidoferrales bacterium]|nr:polysaccharide biosynthesis tyrosine autokinase [Candidatus Acidoferrales bacterium]